MTSESERRLIDAYLDRLERAALAVADVVRPTLSITLTVAALLMPFFLLHLARRRASAESAAPVVSRTQQPIG